MSPGGREGKNDVDISALMNQWTLWFTGDRGTNPVFGIDWPKTYFIIKRDTIKKMKYGEKIKSSVLDMSSSKFLWNRHPGGNFQRVVLYINLVRGELQIWGSFVWRQQLSLVNGWYFLVGRGLHQGEERIPGKDLRKHQHFHMLGRRIRESKENRWRRSGKNIIRREFRKEPVGQDAGSLGFGN